MDSYVFPFVVGGIQQTVEIPLAGTVVMMQPIVQALGMSWKHGRVTLAGYPSVPFKAPGATGRPSIGFDLGTLQDWLNQLNPHASNTRQLVSHFKQHLVPTLRHYLRPLLPDLPVEAAPATSVIQLTPDPIYVDQPLGPLDLVRKELSELHYLPEDINYYVGKNTLAFHETITTYGPLSGKSKQTTRRVSLSNLSSSYAYGMLKRKLETDKRALTSERDYERQHPENAEIIRLDKAARLVEQEGKELLVVEHNVVRLKPWQTNLLGA